MNIATSTAVHIYDEAHVDSKDVFVSHIAPIIQASIDQARAADAARIKQLENEREQLTAKLTDSKTASKTPLPGGA